LLCERGYKGEAQMTIKEFQKDLSQGEDFIVEVKRHTDKSDINKKQQVKLYRTVNGEKVEYIEKTETK
jgi:hypothetical protein